MERVNSVQQKRYADVINKANKDAKAKDVEKGSFGQQLRKEVENNIKVSKHAKKRMASRNINISEEQFNNIDRAVEKASLKGIKDSLIMYEDTALIVSVRNKTIITAMKKDNLKENVITNVDGVVMM